MMTKTTSETPADSPEPVILPRSGHSISRKQIDEDTLKVLYRLHRNGYKAFLVGGSVRDLMLGRTPKDFDVGTDATPGQVKRLFRNGFLVGRRFRLAHIRFGRDRLVEVATFRRQAREEELPEDPGERFLVAENVFGTPREDAFRRDFTINALFYDIADFSVVDHVGGLEDLEARRIRVIGDPLVRFTEDPVRMLRALEFAARLDFSLDPQVREGIYMRAPLIAEAAPARIREELMELFRHRVAGAVLRNAQAMGMLGHLLAGFEGEPETFDLLDQVDRRTGEGVVIEEHFALAALYLHRFLRACPEDGDHNVTDAVKIAGLVLAPHCGYFHVAHRIRHMARELMVGIYRLRRGRGRRGERRFLLHPMTPQALDLYALWISVYGRSQEPLQDWRRALERARRPESEQESGENQPPSPRRRRRRRRPPRRNS